MRVYLLSINFSPEVTGIGPYATLYADALAADGNEVLVITGWPHYPEWRRRPARDGPAPFEISRCWHYVPGSPTALRRVFYEVTFAATTLVELVRRPAPDVLVVVVPPLAASVVASAWSRVRGVAVAVVVQDIVSAAASHSTRAPRIVSAGAALGERFLFQWAQRIGVIHEAMVPKVATNEWIQRKVEIVRNWPLPHHQAIPPKAEARARLKFRPNQFVCTHAGNMGAKQGLEVVIHAARKLADDDAYHFLLVGDGNQRPRLEALARDVRNVEFLPLQTTSRFLDLLTASDALIVSQRANVREMSFPGKLVPYLRSGTPIIASVDARSATGITLLNSRAGLVVPAEDPLALANGLRSLRTQVKLGQELVAAAGTFVRDSLNEDRLRNEFLRFVYSVART